MPANYHETYGINTVTTATVAITDEGYLGRPIVLSRAAGIVATLPFATGSGNRYEFIIGTTVTSNNYDIQVGRAADTMIGTAILFADGGDTTVSFAAVAGTSDAVRMNGTATGGIIGAHVVVTDIAANVWHAHVVSDAAGTEATPFANLVS
jgi:hypothetical protein